MNKDRNGMIGRLRGLFADRRAVRRVADDPALTAELLLLFRMILADGKVDQRELDAFRRICGDAFNIGADDLDEVIEYLHEFGYETSGPQALAMFQALPDERKRQLARHLADIARSDTELHAQELKLLKRTMEILKMEPDDLSSATA
ncbi:MAG: TerB family tellurite resistance protein [Rhizobiaceae bacterium]|nr:TerB family tellurite resistance protein [Rhizobiaceae bacterium]MCV0408810.1 TerB family tellurite resistance protein [Rhizobiaceae bacterium]